MVTIRDIAKKAGVSASTASRALNNNAHISEATIRKVKRIAVEMGYRPDYNAKNLTLGEANAVGVIFPVGNDQVTGNPFYISILSGINQELIKRKYSLSVAIAKTNKDLFENVKSMVMQSKIKRFILLYSKQHDRVANFLRQNELRFVVIGQPPHQYDYYVDNNNVKAGVSATKYLLTHNRVQQPLFVTSDQDWAYECQRYQGFEQVMAQYDLPAQRLQVDLKQLKALDAFILAHPKIDGVVVTDDNLAMEFYGSFHRVYPKRQLAVVSFNHVVPSVFLAEHFNSVDLYPEMMGIKAVVLLFSDREDEKINAKQHLIVKHKIE